MSILNDKLKRCAWCGKDPLYQAYHDREWGVAVVDDKTLFEFVTLEGAQAGLSWITILKRREGYRKAFADFNVNKVSKFSDKKIEKLIHDSSIIRNKLKIKSTVTNAKAFIALQKEYGSFASYLWSFNNYKIKNNCIKSTKDINITNEVSDKLSKDLKKRGFKFMGSTIVYAFMQAVGMVNDHSTDCFRFTECERENALMEKKILGLRVAK